MLDYVKYFFSNKLWLGGQNKIKFNLFFDTIRNSILHKLTKKQIISLYKFSEFTIYDKDVYDLNEWKLKTHKLNDTEVALIEDWLVIQQKEDMWLIYDSVTLWNWDLIWIDKLTYWLTNYIQNKKNLEEIKQELRKHSFFYYKFDRKSIIRKIKFEEMVKNVSSNEQVINNVYYYFKEIAKQRSQ